MCVVNMKILQYLYNSVKQRQLIIFTVLEPTTCASLINYLARSSGDFTLPYIIFLCFLDHLSMISFLIFIFSLYFTLKIHLYFFMSCHPLIITPLWWGPYCVLQSLLCLGLCYNHRNYSVTG